MHEPDDFGNYVILYKYKMTMKMNLSVHDERDYPFTAFDFEIQCWNVDVEIIYGIIESESAFDKYRFNIVEN